MLLTELLRAAPGQSLAAIIMVPPQLLRERNALESELKKHEKKLARKLKEKAPKSLVRTLLDECSAAYDKLENAHYKWLEFLKDPRDVIDSTEAANYSSQQPKWLEAIDKSYNEVIEAAADYLPSADLDTSVMNNTLPSSGVDTQQIASGAANLSLNLSEDVVEKLQPPLVDCMIFGSNPRDWKLFACEFEVNVKAYYPNNEKKLVSYLLKFTSHKAHACVKPHVTSGSKTPFTDAWSDLKNLFGTPAILARHIINDLKEGPSVVSADDLLDFARDIKQAVDQLAATPHESDIKGHAIIDDLLVRLSSNVHTRWTKQALKFKVANDRYPDIFEFLKFIKLLAAESSDEYYGLEAAKSRASKANSRYRKKNDKSAESSSMSFSQEVQNAALASGSGRGAGSSNGGVPDKCQFCEKSRHDLHTCPVFLGLNHAQRWDVRLANSRLCWKCLSISCRVSRKCKAVKSCKCAMPYHVLLHPPPCTAQLSRNVNDNGVIVGEGTFDRLPPVMEIICGGVPAFALFDTGSAESYISSDLAQRIGLNSFESREFSRTLLGMSDSAHRVVEQVNVSSLDRSVDHTLKNVLVTPQIPGAVRTATLDPGDFAYLDGVSLTQQEGAAIDLVVGCSSGLLVPQKVLEHPVFPNENPYAIKYKLGWVITGPFLNSKVTSNAVLHGEGNNADSQYVSMETNDTNTGFDTQLTGELPGADLLRTPTRGHRTLADMVSQEVSPYMRNIRESFPPSGGSDVMDSPVHGVTPDATPPGLSSFSDMPHRGRATRRGHTHRSPARDASDASPHLRHGRQASRSPDPGSRRRSARSRMNPSAHRYAPDGRHGCPAPVCRQRTWDGRSRTSARSSGTTTLEGDFTRNPNASEMFAAVLEENNATPRHSTPVRRVVRATVRPSPRVQDQADPTPTSRRYRGTPHPRTSSQQHVLTTSFRPGGRDVQRYVWDTASPPRHRAPLISFTPDVNSTSRGDQKTNNRRQLNKLIHPDYVKMFRRRKSKKIPISAPCKPCMVWIIVAVITTVTFSVFLL